MRTAASMRPQGEWSICVCTVILTFLTVGHYNENSKICCVLETEQVSETQQVLAFSFLRTKCIMSYQPQYMCICI
jgi:hypothetical protein